ncbi:LytS/YhcK type 5TM receptor domain-containing protein, partial [Klebsiella pneumoniae]|uniref:LytS/YhcK type 5TM receptor domain-containing protein n=1 Tax=Klebsiella pneumoniae TaxID=573 RepID=UPI003F765333
MYFSNIARLSSNIRINSAAPTVLVTIVEGLLGGLVHSNLIRRGRTDKVFNPITAGAVTFVAEMVQML